MKRLFQAIRSFFAILFTGSLPDHVAFELGFVRRGAPPPAPPKPQASAAGPAEGAVQLLALLQREARLVDFLLEDISPYTDEQVGAAVRGIHDQSRAALERHVSLAPVVDGVEGTQTRLDTAGLDPKDTVSLKLIGNVPPGGAIQAGILRHRGWRADRVDLPPLPGRKALVVAPAEIEVE